MTINITDNTNKIVVNNTKKNINIEVKDAVKIQNNEQTLNTNVTSNPISVKDHSVNPVSIKNTKEEISLYPKRGPQGEQGIQGIQGLTGNDGAQGNDGAAGPQGSAGATGATGSQGIQGIQGEKGDTGDQGIQGIQGPAGSSNNYIGPEFTYTNGNLTRIDYNNSAYKTITYNSDDSINTVVLTDGSATTTKTFSYNSDGTLDEIIQT